MRHFATVTHSKLAKFSFETASCANGMAGTRTSKTAIRMKNVGT